MKVRNAKVADARDIAALINQYAEQDKMLFRSLADIYENLQTFMLVEAEGRLVGCCALEVVWADLAEIKSLAVDQQFMNMGVGRMLVGAAAEQAKKLGLPRIFALTLTPAFFLKLGFEIIDRDKLPMKVWSDCARCPKQQNCDEIAVVKNLPLRA